jgi:hypothetical protein
MKHPDEQKFLGKLLFYQGEHWMVVSFPRAGWVFNPSGRYSDSAKALSVGVSGQASFHEAMESPRVPRHPETACPGTSRGFRTTAAPHLMEHLNSVAADRGLESRRANIVQTPHVNRMLYGGKSPTFSPIESTC